MRTFDLSPLFRSTVGFDRLNEMLDAAMRDENATYSYPPYNIEKYDNDKYRIVMAVSGFKQDDITITLQKNMLSIVGKLQDSQAKDAVTYLYKGIANRAFERRFNLADYMKVADATLEDGLLVVYLVREVPEEVKPRLIEIKTNGSNTKKLANK